MKFFCLLLATLCGAALAKPLPAVKPDFENLSEDTTDLQSIMWNSVYEVEEAYGQQSCMVQVTELNRLLEQRASGSVYDMKAQSKCVVDQEPKLLPVLKCDTESYNSTDHATGKMLYHICSDVNVDVQVKVHGGRRSTETIQMGCYCTRNLRYTDVTDAFNEHVH